MAQRKVKGEIVKSVKVVTVLVVLCASFGIAQGVEELNSDGVKYAPSSWTGFWITHPEVALREYGVVHFRRSFELSERP